MNFIANSPTLLRPWSRHQKSDWKTASILLLPNLWWATKVREIIHSWSIMVCTVWLFLAKVSVWFSSIAQSLASPSVSKPHPALACGCAHPSTSMRAPHNHRHTTYPSPSQSQCKSYRTYPTQLRILQHSSPRSDGTTMRQVCGFCQQGLFHQISAEIIDFSSHWKLLFVLHAHRNSAPHTKNI